MNGFALVSVPSHTRDSAHMEKDWSRTLSCLLNPHNKTPNRCASTRAAAV